MTIVRKERTRESLWGDGGTQEAMAGFVAALNQADDARSPSFEVAMDCLVLVTDRAASNDPIPSERMKAFWVDVGAALARLAADVAWYVQLTLFRAEAKGDGDLFDLCVHRSAIQLLMDDSSTAAAVAAIERDDLDELDQELRRIGDDYGAVPERFLPHGIPRTHWWWWYPSACPVEDVRR